MKYYAYSHKKVIVHLYTGVSSCMGRTSESTCVQFPVYSTRSTLIAYQGQRIMANRMQIFLSLIIDQMYSTFGRGGGGGSPYREVKVQSALSRLKEKHLLFAPFLRIGFAAGQQLVLGGSLYILNIEKETWFKCNRIS